MNRSMTRKLITALLLCITVSAQAAPVAAGVRSCPAPGRAASRSCMRCDAMPRSTHTTAFSAGSCCRYGAVESTTRAPGVVPSTSRFEESGIGMATLPGTCGTPAPVLSPSTRAHAPPRSTDSPPSLHTPLRL